MALSPMLILLPAGAPAMEACRGLVAAAAALDLRPRLVLPPEGPDLGARAADTLRLDLADDDATFERLADWTSPVPPASLWAPWRGDNRFDPRAFRLADRLADALPKAPVVFEYLPDAPAEPLPREARAFALQDGSALYLVLD